MGYTTSQGAVISVSVDGAAATQRQLDGIAQSMGKLSSLAQNLAASVGIGGGIVEVAHLSDEYTKFTSQLRLATQSQSEYQASLASVQRIAHDSQADLAATGTLYARITNGTRELSIGQKQVADITEVVNLALKVSAATTEESASAQLQLSQAFASGTLRGEEFNAVNEAAPRLMKALADGIGVPVGALKQMASEGKITSEVMAAVLPKSLEGLRQEAQQVQTIGGAFTNLKNNVLEYTATNAQANGSVAVLTGSIGLLSNNLALVAGTLTTITAVKAANWAAAWTVETYRKIAADQASRAATLAAAEADLARLQAAVANATATTAQVTATQAAIITSREEAVARLSQANANILSANAAIEAATAAGTQSFALRTLRLATAELQVAEAARRTMLAELAVLGQQQVRVSAEIAAARTAEAAATRAAALAQTGGAVAAGLATRAMGLLGGPVGAIVTVLGLAATAWSVYGSKSEEANKQAAQSVEASTPEIVANLEKQNVKLRERLALMKQGMPELAKGDSPQAKRLAETLTEINALVAKSNDLKAKGQELDIADQAQLYALGLQYSNLSQAAEQNKGLKAEIDASGTALTDLIAVRERLSGVDKQYFEDLKKLQTAREKGAIGDQEYISLVSQLATETYKKSEAGKVSVAAAHKETEAYAALIAAIRSKIDENRLELAMGENATDSQKTEIKLDQELASGKLKLSAAHQAAARAALAEQAAGEQALKLRDAQRDLTKYIVESTLARNNAAAALQVEYDLYGKSADAREIAMVAVRADADAEKKLADLRAANKPVTAQMIAQLKAERDARVLVEQATLGQGKALQYAVQLAEENKKFGLQYIADDKQRAAAELAIDDQVWQERIRLAGEGTEAQKRLQQEYTTWYQNQAAKPFLDEQKKIWTSVEQTAHDTFISIFDSGKSAFDRLRDALKNGLLDLLYQMTMKKWIIDMQASVGMSTATTAMQAAGLGSSSGGSSLIGSAQSAASLYSAGKAMYTGFQSGITSSMGGAITSMGNLFGSTAMSSFGAGMSSPGAAAIMSELGQGTATGSVAASDMAVAGSASTAAGASAATYAIPIIGWILAGMGLSSKLYAGGWDASNGSLKDPLKLAGGSQIFNNALKGIGLSDSEANMFSGMSTYAKLFGRKNPKVESQGIEGTISSSGFDGDAFAKIIEEGGWFRSDKRYTQNADLSVAQDASLDNTVQSMMLAVKGFADALGVNADQVDGYTKAINLTLTDDDAQNQKLLADLFGQIGDELSLKLVPDLDKFTKSGETASATLQRLASDFQGTDQIAQMMGFSASTMFGAAGMQSAAAREKLIDLAGGLSTLGQQAAFFNQNFLTDAERIAPVAAALDKALASLGLDTIPTTRNEFKALVDDMITSGAAGTEAGAKRLASLLALDEAFAQVHPAEAAADAVDKVTAALQAMKDSASSLLGGVDAAYSVLEKVAAREKAAAQASVDAHSAVVSKLQSLSQALSSTLNSIESPDQKLADRAVGQAQIRAALAIAEAGGPLPDADSLKDALSAVTQDAASQFSSYTDYLRDLYQTQSDIAQLGEVTDSQLSVEQLALKAAQDQLKSLDDILSNAQQEVDVLKGVDTNGLTLVQAMQALTQAIVGAKSNPIVGATSAINGAYQQYLGRAPDAEGLQWWQNAAASGAPVDQIVDGIAGSTEATLRKVYASELNRAPDAGGLSFWMGAYGSQMDAAELADWMKVTHETDEYKKLHPFAIGTNFIPEDMPALVHRGERIIPAADNRALMARLSSPASNNDALLAEVKALRAEVQALRVANSAENSAIARHTLNTSDHLDAAINGDTPLATKVIPA